MKLFLFLLFPIAGFSQNSFDVFLEVLPGQQFELINDSLFPPGIHLKCTGNIVISDSSVRSIDVSLFNENGISLHASTTHVSINDFSLGSFSLSVPLGQFTALNQYTATAVLRNGSGSVIQTITYSSNNE